MHTKTCRNKKCYKLRKPNVLDSVAGTSHTFSEQGILPFLMATSKNRRFRGTCTKISSDNCQSLDLPLLEKNLIKIRFHQRGVPT